MTSTVKLNLDLDAIERDLSEFEAARSVASPGPWVRGFFYGQCVKHPDGAHPGRSHPTDPCETTWVLADSGQQSRCVSSADRRMLIGWREDGDAILSAEDAGFLLAARNLPITDHCHALIDEVKRLRKQIKEASCR